MVKSVAFLVRAVMRCSRCIKFIDVDVIAVSYSCLSSAQSYADKSRKCRCRLSVSQSDKSAKLRAMSMINA